MDESEEQKSIRYELENQIKKSLEFIDEKDGYIWFKELKTKYKWCVIPNSKLPTTHVAILEGARIGSKWTHLLGKKS